MDVFKKGQQVAIDVDFDNIEVGSDVIFGEVTEVTVLEKRVAGTMMHEVLIKAVTDDGTVYETIKRGNLMQPHYFVTSSSFIFFVNNRFTELKQALDKVVELNQLFDQQMIFRAENGYDFKGIEPGVTKMLETMLDYFDECAARNLYLRDKIFPKYFRKIPGFRMRSDDT
ncbi:MAG: hypothetical protein MJ244_03080 [Clostridia bacterium]|nr:hypothetical protein [Clostridia bacterium]